MYVFDFTLDAGRAGPLAKAMAAQGVLVTTPGKHTVRLLLPYFAGRAELAEIWGALGRAIAATA